MGHGSAWPLLADLVTAGLAPAGRAARPALPGARCRSAAGDRIRRETQPPLKGATRGFMPEYSPAGFGYQIQKCIVYSSGCQKVNAAPVPGAVVGQSAWLRDEGAVCVLTGRREAAERGVRQRRVRRDAGEDPLQGAELPLAAGVLV